MSATATAVRDARDQRTVADRAADEARAADAGLSGREAAARLERYGPNALEERRHNTLLELASHFWGPIPWMIEAAVVLTALTARWADFGIILALLLLNGAVGFWEEHQAAGAIAALKERLATRARVLRDGSWTTIPAVQVVPGDLVTVGRGDVVPADGMLAGVAEADESMLTGESLPVEKGPGDALFSGTAIVRGNPRLRVLATGARTELGRTAELTGAAGPQSHFQRAIVSIGTYLIALAVALVGVIVVVSLLRGTSLADTLELALVVTIASIPVALPAVLSVTLAVGARSLAKHEAVVSYLPAVEEMAGVDVLCSDKTGTITKNELAVADVAVLAAGATRADVLRAAALTAEPGGADPLDGAVLAALDGDIPGGDEVVALEPFDAGRKRAEALVRDARGHERRVAKGANQAILELTGADGDGAERVAAATRAFAEKGYRALAVAGTGGGNGSGADGRGEDGEGGVEADTSPGTDWHVLGVLALADPPREDSRATLAAAAALGVEVKMVTGDRVEIAHQIARELAMGDAILEATAIERLDGDALAAQVERADGFAQVVPEDKYRIVEALQAHGHIVGMTGDGVNDAPALSRADAGIAVLGRDRRGARRGRHRAAERRAVGDRRGDLPRARGLPAHGELRDLPHHRDDPDRPVRDDRDRPLRVLPGHADADRAAGDPQRRGDPHDRLRPCAALRTARALAADGGPHDRDGARPGRRRGVAVAARDRRRPAARGARGGADADLPQAVGRRPPDPVRRSHARAAVVAPPRDRAAGGGDRDAAARDGDRRLRPADGAAALAARGARVGLRDRVDPAARPAQADRLPRAGAARDLRPARGAGVGAAELSGQADERSAQRAGQPSSPVRRCATWSGGLLANVRCRPAASAAFSADDRRASLWISVNCSGGISPERTTSETSPAGGCGCWFHSEALRRARPSSTSCCTSHETGATLLYHGHVVRLLWQAPQARANSCCVRALSHLGCERTGGLACARPYGTSWISANAAIAASTTRGAQKRSCARRERESTVGPAMPGTLAPRSVAPRPRKAARRLRRSARRGRARCGGLRGGGGEPRSSQRRGMGSVPFMPESGPESRILLVESERSIAEALARALGRAGYAITTAASPADALALAVPGAFDLVLLDGALQENAGHELRDALHDRAGIPVVVLADSLLAADRDAWSNGAEDYLVKPVRDAEAVARVRGVLRRIAADRARGGAGAGEILRVGPLTLDTVTHRARLERRELALAPLEVALLERLMRDPGRVVSRHDLIADVWDGSRPDASRTLDMHIGSLRRKLGEDPARPRFVHTVRGVGFRISSPGELARGDFGSAVHR